MQGAGGVRSRVVFLYIALRHECVGRNAYHQDLALLPTGCHASSTSTLLAKLSTAEEKTFDNKKVDTRVGDGEMGWVGGMNESRQPMTPSWTR